MVTRQSCCLLVPPGSNQTLAVLKTEGGGHSCRYYLISGYAHMLRDMCTCAHHTCEEQPPKWESNLRALLRRTITCRLWKATWRNGWLNSRSRAVWGAGRWWGEAHKSWREPTMCNPGACIGQGPACLSRGECTTHHSHAGGWRATKQLFPQGIPSAPLPRSVAKQRVQPSRCLLATNNPRRRSRCCSPFPSTLLCRDKHLELGWRSDP